MKDQIKVGDEFLLNSDSKITARITAIGESRLLALKMYPHMQCHEYDYLIESFLKNYTLKKPEPKLKKLVAWLSVENGVITDISTEDDKVFCNKDRYIKKEIIIKDGDLFVED